MQQMDSKFLSYNVVSANIALFEKQNKIKTQNIFNKHISDQSGPIA